MDYLIPHRFTPADWSPHRCQCGNVVKALIHQLTEKALPFSVPSRYTLTHKDLNFLKLVSLGVSYESWVELARRSK